MTPGQIAGTTILVAGFVMTIVGLVLAIALDPLIGGVIFLVGVSDVVVGMMFRSGRLGGQQAAAEKAAPVDTATTPDPDPNEAAYGTTADGAAITGDENPYARED